MRNVIWKGGTRQELSKKEKILLQGMIESQGGESITDLCRRKKVSPKTYYRMVNNPHLGSLLPEAIDFLLGQQIIPVIQVIVKKALSGSGKHAELVLRISGLISSDETKILQVFGSKNEGQKFLTENQIDRLLGGSYDK